MGSSGGGGSSGAVSYPAYMETWHSTWLNNIATAMTTAQAASPYSTADGYNPSTDTGTMNTAINDFTTDIADYDPTSATAFWETLFGDVETAVDVFMDDSYIDADLSDTFIEAVMDDTYITDAMADHRAVLEDQLNSEVLPEYKGSMRTLGAVQTSAYAIGEALLRARLDRDVSKYGSDLEVALSQKRVDLRSKMILDHNKYNHEFQMTRAGIINDTSKYLNQFAMQYIETLKVRMHYVIEYCRLRIVANKEYRDADYEYNAKDALWDLETFQYGGNLLAGIAGGTTSMKQNTPSKTASAIGGAVSGAGIGSMIASGASSGSSAGPWGAAIGAIVGGVAGLLSS